MTRANTSFASDVATGYGIVNETATALGRKKLCRLRQRVLQSSVEWFNPAAAIRVESRKPTGFILPAIREFSPSMTHIESMRTAVAAIHVKPTVHDELVQILTQMHWDQLRSPWIQSRPHLRVYKEDLHPRSLLQSQKSG